MSPRHAGAHSFTELVTTHLLSPEVNAFVWKACAAREKTIQDRQPIPPKKMDFTEVPVSQGGKGKRKNKKVKTKDVSKDGEEGSSGAEKTESATATFPPSFSLAEVKNKQRRHLMFMKLKQEKRKVIRSHCALL